MNIFILSWCVQQCAAWHFDRHAVKMIVELAQLLSTAHWELDQEGETAVRVEQWCAGGLMYKATHRNHPCAKWVRRHPNNYRYTVRLAKALCDEYYRRYGVDRQRRHKTETIVDHLASNEPTHWPECTDPLVGPAQVTQPAQAMPDEYKVQGDAVAAYRAYYQSAQKRHLTSWKRRAPPEWFDDDGAETVTPKRLKAK